MKRLVSFIKLIPLFLVSFAVWLSACAPLKTTQVRTQNELPIEELFKNANGPIQITQDTILLDARSSFDYSILHVPDSIHLEWQEFSDHRGPSPGILKTDYLTFASRLARFGINKQSKVVIVGYGKNGKGEEGRLAWTLFFLGISNVQFAELNYFKTKLTQNPPEPRESVPIWKPELRNSTMATIEDIKKNINSLNKDLVFIDCRTPQEINKDTFKMNIPTIQIDWREFLTRDGRVQIQLKQKLLSVGIKPHKKIIVISNNGLRSSTVLMALLSMGYDKASHLPGGWTQIKSEIQ